MEFLITILLIFSASAYVTSIPCRVLLARHRRAGWYLGFVGAVAVGILTVLVIYQGDVFHPDRWERGKAPLEILMLMAFGFSSAIGLVPAFLVVGHYRRRFRDEKPVA
jgi:hypothetical protein